MNIINRYNYEEYFLLYIDNELTLAEKQTVESFVQENPDLKIELEMLQQSITAIDNDVIFNYKDSLLKSNSLLINEANHEEYFILYADHELTNGEKAVVEQFVYRNTQYQAEFELLQQVKLKADRHIVFSDKASLYRTEKENIYIVPWWKMAAAAIIFIFLSGWGWYMLSNKATAPAMVNNTTEKENQVPVLKLPEQKQETIIQTKPAITDIITLETIRSSPEKKKKVIVTPSQEEKQMLMLTKDSEKNITARNIQLPTNVIPERPKVNITDMPTSSNIASVDKATHLIDKSADEPTINPSMYTASNNEIEILNTTFSKKNKLRGLFRKVSRVVEKNTNIETAENGRGIRIANFEVALK